MKPRNSYSQFGEDILLREFFPEKIGQYIDIGAGRPVKGSNTYNFYRSGWSGVTVDPILLNSFMHKIFRSRDQFWLALCGYENEVTLELYEFFPYEYTTMQREVAELLIKDGLARLVDRRLVVCYPATKFTRCMDPRLPTLLCIDAEGSDYQVLQSIDFEQIRPRVICVESLVSSAEPKEIEEFLRSSGYALAAIAGHSLIFVHESFEFPPKDATCTIA